VIICNPISERKGLGLDKMGRAEVAIRLFEHFSDAYGGANFFRQQATELLTCS